MTGPHSCTTGAALALVLLLPSAALAYEMGPVHGADYDGGDYNITAWNSPKSAAGKDGTYRLAAMACEAYCLADENCCAWAYCPPGTGSAAGVGGGADTAPPLVKNDPLARADMDTLGERCCLKNIVEPIHHGTAHWAGLAPRAVTDHTNKTLTKRCQGPPPPPPVPAGCTEVGGTCVYPYPGKAFLHPKIHASPDCLHLGGWHDVAGALTYPIKGSAGEHHVFQGCPASMGWSHAVSKDLVHWADQGRGVHTLDETYEGMESTHVSPCSGFVTVDDEGTPCAGFRQCSSSNGTTGLNPAAKSWDVPMEIRCAKNKHMTEWGKPIWIYPVYYYRHLPYDPVRPWKDFDGKWYSSWSTDGCNSTTKKVPCAAGGQLELLVSDALHGAKANWKQLAPMFTTNVTKSGLSSRHGAIMEEFVTSGYFGGLVGDPDGGKTRVVTQNNPTPTYWVGKQANGSPFEAYWDKVGAVGHYDYGTLTMARTLGGDPNQVATNGRRVLVGWIGGTPASQSLARDLSLSKDYELLQAFVPELEMLRQPASFEQTRLTHSDVDTRKHSTGSLQLEVVATFSWTGPNPTTPFGVSVLAGQALITVDCTLNPDGTWRSPDAPCMVTTTPATGPVMPIGVKRVTVHAIVDHEIVETIVNNRTAMVTYHKNIPSANSTKVELFGIKGLDAHIVSWSLDAANNFANKDTFICNTEKARCEAGPFKPGYPTMEECSKKCKPKPPAPAPAAEGYACIKATKTCERTKSSKVTHATCERECGEEPKHTGYVCVEATKKCEVSKHSNHTAAVCEGECKKPAPSPAKAGFACVKAMKKCERSRTSKLPIATCEKECGEAPITHYGHVCVEATKKCEESKHSNQTAAVCVDECKKK